MAEDKDTRISLGISSCLLGNKVRYDGGHKKDPFLMDTLGRYVRYVPVCPEMECGMPAPREPMRLEGEVGAPRLITHTSKRDLTDSMRRWGESRLAELESLGLCGYIFKTKSPSCGMARIKVFTTKDNPSPRGVGIWARMFMDRFPLLPVEDESRLHDPGLRENFIERIFVFKRWRETVAASPSLAALLEFHTRHKLILMAHSPELYRKTGKLVAEAKGRGWKTLEQEYLGLLGRALALPSTVKKNANVLHHIQGYFKKQLSPDEKQELLGLIGSYAGGYIPLVVPATLLNHYVRKYGQAYLAEQYYLNPHPLELKLRNHT